MIHYRRDKSAKVAIGFEARLQINRVTFWSDAVTYAAKVHGPKGDQINESPLYIGLNTNHIRYRYTSHTVLNLPSDK